MSYEASRRIVAERDKCCFLCLHESGIISPIESIHHVVARSKWGREDEAKHEVRNLVGLCGKCHQYHKPYVSSFDMTVYILGLLHKLHGYEYRDEKYAHWARTLYEEDQ